MEGIAARDEWHTWISRENSLYAGLLTSMVKTNELCREKLQPWITWFEEMDSCDDYVQLI